MQKEYAAINTTLKGSLGIQMDPHLSIGEVFGKADFDV
jgi:hypothetical protein